MNTFKNVPAYGPLKVTGTSLTDKNGNIVILKGMSSHGMQWYPQFAKKKSILATKMTGANVFRIAMYTAEGGYLTDPYVAEDVKRAADDTLSLDMYAIIDWHICIDNDPLTNMEKAIKFFDEMSCRYRKEPGIIYEICNEPNGDAVTWSGSVKPYAERVIPVIRGNSPDAIVLVGSPSWSQDADIAAADPLAFKNIMYTLHFYAGTHGSGLREKCLKAIESGAPVFASEWGTSRMDGSGGVYPKESDEWLEFLSRHDISWCNWNLADRDETSAALLPGAPEDWNESNLSESGRFVMSRLRSD
jgi:endoglucanase